MSVLSGKTPLLNRLCALLVLLLLVFQFLPLWNVGEGEDAQSVSMHSYIWFPEDHGEVEDYLTAQVGENYTINSVLAMPIILLVAGLISLVLCFIKAEIPAVSLAPLVCGATGVWGFLFNPAFRLGSTWVVQLILCVVLLALALITLFNGRNE